MEDWVYGHTYSGTPQGGVVSPLLANIYLHELDQLMQGMKAASTKVEARRPLSALRSAAKARTSLRRKIERLRTDGADQAKIDAALAKIKANNLERRKLPSVDPMDPNFKRLRYCRYADDFLIGVIGNKREAREIMASVEQFLTDALKLAVAPEKSGIHAASKGVTFLGYRISTYTSCGAGRKSRRTGPEGRSWRVVRRPTTGNVSLRVPRKEIAAFCRRHGYGDLVRHNGRRREQFADTSDRDIVLAFNSEFRGFANYYAFADDVKRALGVLELVVFRSFLKTLAMRHRSTTARIMKRLRRGTEYEVTSVVRGQVRSLKLWRLKHLIRQCWMTPRIDVITAGAWWMPSPNGLVDRLKTRVCEACGASNGPFEMHHRRHLLGEPGLPMAINGKAVFRRKTIVLCLACRQSLSSRRLQRMESRVH